MRLTPVPYPELFWSRYTGLGSQTQTPKRSKVLISGVSFRQHSLSQNQQSNVLSYSECKIAKNFQGFAPGPNCGGVTAPPDSPTAQRIFSLLHSSKNRHPQKIAGYGTDPVPCHWSLSILPKNNRKPEVFLRFQEVYFVVMNTLLLITLCRYST